MTVFLRIIEAAVDEKPHALLQAVRSASSSKAIRPVFAMSPAGFAAVPGSPFAYWASSSVLQLFLQLSAFETGNRIARITNPVADNFRFLRVWWEVAHGLQEASIRWVHLFKGGAYSQYYFDPHLLVAWDSTRDTYVGFVGTSHRPLEKPACADLFLRPGITWPVRTSGLSFRLMPRDCAFSSKGPAAFVEGDEPVHLLALSAIMNCRVFGYLVRVQLARTELAQSYEVGLIQQTPVPNLSEESSIALARLAQRAWSLQRSLDTSTETSHAFLLPQGLSRRTTRVDARVIERELADIRSEVDELTFTLYGISAQDREAIQAPTERTMADSGDADEAYDDADEGDDVTAETAADAQASWLVGVAFGRFDPRLATGERAIPAEPGPFDPLPSRSPGMYPEGEEPADRPDILVDDEGHADDLAARAITIAECVKVDAPENLRAWLARMFFPLHIKMYSRSRRKAPIYWQLATPSAGYSVWLYIPAFSKDTLFRVQNDYVASKLAHEERRLESLSSELRAGATAAQRKQLAAQDAHVEELRAFLDEVKRVAPLWKPSLDDGVLINFAPLWRLVPQNKAWLKELKSTWDALAEGKYDWAHLAMHLWPERVVPRCAKDRSLAIAHGLEDVFWVEGTDGKWTARKTPTKSVDELVKERTSPAVKSALKSLLEAPLASGTSTGRKGGGRRKAGVSAEGGDA